MYTSPFLKKSYATAQLVDSEFHLLTEKSDVLQPELYQQQAFLWKVTVSSHGKNSKGVLKTTHKHTCIHTLLQYTHACIHTHTPTYTYNDTPRALHTQSNCAKHFLNGVTAIKWRKWFTETGETITVTGQNSDTW